MLWEIGYLYGLQAIIYTFKLFTRLSVTLVSAQNGWWEALMLLWSLWSALWVQSLRRFLAHLMSSLHLFFCPSIPLSHSLCPLWKLLSPLALLFSSPSVRLLQAALLPLCLPHVLPLEDMHLGSCCTLLCVLINILAASGRKWVFLRANLLWGGCLEQRKEKMIEEEGQARLFLFSMSEAVETSNTNQMPRNYE